MKENSDLVYKIASQDLSVGIEALNENNFELLNIMGNRIATTFTFGGEERYIILGFILKEYAAIFPAIQKSEQLTKTKPEARHSLKEIKSLFEEKDPNVVSIWDLYLDAEEKVRTLIPPKKEREKYSENPDYTTQSRKILLKHLDERSHLLLEGKHKIITGIVKELGRIIATHGFHRKDFVYYLTLKAFSASTQFLNEELSVVNDEKDKREQLNSDIERIIGLENGVDNQQNFYIEAAEFIGDVGARWRMYFIDYGELTESKEKGKKVELPEKTKDKISDILTEGLKEEIEK